MVGQDGTHAHEIVGVELKEEQEPSKFQLITAVKSVLAVIVLPGAAILRHVQVIYLVSLHANIINSLNIIITQEIQNNYS